MPGAPRAASVWPSERRRGHEDAPQALRSAVLRLQTRNQFQVVLAGERIASTAHFVLHRQTLPHPRQALTVPPSVRADLFAAAPPDASWLGALVPKRWARRAVTRNAIKRQIYAVSSQHAFDVRPAAYVVRLRAAFDRQQFVSASSSMLKAQVRQELQQLFNAMDRAASIRSAALTGTKA